MSPAEILGAIQNRIRMAPSFLWRAEAKFKGAECAPDVMFFGRPLISVVQGSRMVLSSGVQVRSAMRSAPMGCFQPAVLRTLSANATLELHKNVGLSAAVIMAAKSITIGEGTIIGAGAVVIDSDFHQPIPEWGWSNDYEVNARPVKIGRGAFIGARAIVLKGVTIGDRAIVAAGAVVFRNVPENTIAVGNPAEIIRRACSHE